MTTAAFSQQGRRLASSVLQVGASHELATLAHNALQAHPTSVEFLEHVITLATMMMTNPDYNDDEQMMESCQILLGHLLIRH